MPHVTATIAHLPSLTFVPYPNHSSPEMSFLMTGDNGIPPQLMTESFALLPSDVNQQRQFDTLKRTTPFDLSLMLTIEQTVIDIQVLKPTLKLVGSKNVEFYEVSTQSDYVGFHPVGTVVYRRYSEFQMLRRVLLRNGVRPLRLSWTRWIPGYMSRWEELTFWVEHLRKLKYDKDCLKELKKFCEDESPYQPEERPTSLWFMDQFFK